MTELPPELVVDEQRVAITDDEREHNGTRIFVRARRGSQWGSFDIAELERDSLVAWLRSRGSGDADVRMALFLLGHPETDGGAS